VNIYVASFGVPDTGGTVDSGVVEYIALPFASNSRHGGTCSVFIFRVNQSVKMWENFSVCLTMIMKIIRHFEKSGDCPSSNPTPFKNASLFQHNFTTSAVEREV